MPGEEEFRIKVVTTTDGKGAQQAAQDLGKVEEKAKAAGEEGDKGGKKLDEGLTKTAKAAEKAAGGLDKVEKSAKHAKDASHEAGEKIKGMGEAGEAAEYGFRSTSELAESLTMVLKGDLAMGALQGGGAIEALSKALLGGPWGIAAVALGALASVVALFATNSDKAEGKADDLATAVGKLGPKSREIAEKLLAIAKAAEQQAEKTAQAKTPTEQIADAFKKAADEAERYKAIRGQIAAQDTALALAETNLAEATGKISSEQAAAQRTAIEYADKTRKADDSTIASAYAKQRALEQLHKAEREKQSADAAAYKAGKEFESKGGQLPMSPEALAQQLKQAEETVKRNEHIVVGGADPSGQAWKSIEEAKARDKKRLEDLQALAAAYAKLAEAEAKAKEAQENLNKASAEEKEAGEKANRDIQQQKVDREVARKEAQTESQKAVNEKAKGDRDFRQRAEKMREQAIGDVRRHVDGSQADDGKGATARSPVATDSADRAAALAESQSIAHDASGLKGRSSDATNRLLEAAGKLKDGSSTDELDALNSALDKVATSLERIGQGDKAKPFRELMARVTRLEGVVTRLQSQQGGTGS